ncbi:MAG: TIGR00296 family protein [Thermoplasmata archaeon]
MYVVNRYTDEEGIFSVKVARMVVEDYLNNREIRKIDFQPKFENKAGVFTTINSYPSGDLRGCIGFPEPIYPLKDALIKSAIYAATEDPRFPPLHLNELDKVTFEVSLLTVPEEMKDIKPENIKIGRDGLIIRYGFYSGLLLPQVAVEERLTSEEFLDMTCLKAGLSPGCWKNKNAKLYTFQAEIFREEKPGGKIYRVYLDESDFR